ncbi:uncharacterized protein LOC114416264 [Glycine soja]|uniref:uncharacterized protein LOC114416264 n=1 Tax=Glycine soja TaxID=3848 RepID=UPI00103EDD1A|nr:uncharacterized protein LOC114416264 [Glycine soja]
MKNEVVESLVESRQNMHTKLQKRLKKAQDSMKKHTDARRDDVTFAVNQWVYVKLRPTHQRSDTGTHHPKLSKRYIGPFKILAKVGEVAYRLDLPTEARIHPVFHFSLLRLHHGPPPSSTELWTLEIVGQKPMQRPLCILDSKLDTSTSPPTQLVLTQWVGQPPEDTSWEPWLELRDTYHLEDKVVSKDRGIASIQASIDANEEAHSATMTDDAPARPARAVTRPGYLRDYVS